MIDDIQNMLQWLAACAAQNQIFWLPLCCGELNLAELWSQAVKASAVGLVNPVNVQDMTDSIHYYLWIIRARPKLVKKRFPERHAQYAVIRKAPQSSARSGLFAS